MTARLLFLLSALTGSHLVSAQRRQGAIIYEQKIDIRRHIKDDEMRAMAPPFQTTQYELFYRDSVCFYDPVPKDEAPDPFDNPTAGGNHIVFHFGGPGDAGVLYRNFSNGQLLQQTTLDDVTYVINDSIHSLPWKLTTDTLTVLGHLCKKATAITSLQPRNKVPVIAWYCEDIPLPIGPEVFGGLPGAILKFDIDSGAIVYTATRITASIDPKSMKIPTGKKITRADYEKKIDDKFGPPDSQGRRIIRN